MTKEQFIEVIKLHKQSTDNLNEYYKMGLDLLDNKKSPVEPLFKVIDILFDSIYTEEGVDWISWYIYDNNYGEEELTAFDGETQICKNIDELYDYIQKYKKTYTERVFTNGALNTQIMEELTKALRYNDGKPKWGLVHYDSLIPMIRVLEFGALKYTPWNWMKPMPTREILESMQRHLAALMDGEEYDSESEIDHMGHIQANAMFYNFQKKREKQEENESKK